MGISRWVLNKRTLLTVVLVVASFTMVFAGGQRPAKAQPAGSSCSNYHFLSGMRNPGSSNGDTAIFEAGEVITVTATLLSPGTATFRIYDGNIFPAGTLAGPTDAPGTLTYTVPFTGSQAIGFENIGSSTANVYFAVSCGVGGPDGKALPLFTDGRENKNDALQTAAVYCGVPHDGDVRVYALFNQVGTVAFTVTKAELAAGVQKPATPYLIKSGKGAELWRLQDGSLRIKRGTYVFDWPGC